MQYLTFADQCGPDFPVAFLVSKLDRDAISREYIRPSPILAEEAVAYEISKTGKKTPIAHQKAYLDDLLVVLDDLKTEYLLVGDSDYFKTLTGVTKSDPYIGYVLPNAYPAHMAGRFHVIFLPNPRQVFYNPAPVRAKIALSMEGYWNHKQNRYAPPGDSIIHSAAYPDTVEDIEAWLQKLLAYPFLGADIEGFSLKHHSAGIGTIAFAWSQHDGVAFAVDLGSDGAAVRKLLRDFFQKYTGSLRWHNASYDVMVLIYQLYMKDLLDVEGTLSGLDIFFGGRWDDTKLISYLATNTCAGNKLGLKEQSQEFAGNYAQEDIKDITKIPLPQLLEYNLVDAMATNYVYDKNYSIMVADQQEELYEGLFKSALIDIVQMQLTGMPVDMKKVLYAQEQLELACADAVRRIQDKTLVKAFTYELDLEHVKARNEAMVKKRIALGDEPQVFNPNSGPQLQRLLYEEIGLPIIERTKTKLPATGSKVLEKLRAYTTDQDVLDLLTALVDYNLVYKIITSFIPPLLNSVLGPDGHYWLYGNFNLGGTLSGRLSSSDPNLQNLPAHSKYAKLIKDCFRAPPGYLMIGLDFASLEDRISALTTRDPNKLKVYTDGYDGHSLRAQSYFGESMPDIELAPDQSRCFHAVIGSQDIWFHEHEDITYLGQQMTGLELWDRLQNVRVAA